MTSRYKCYIASSATTETGFLRELLRQRGVEAQDAFDFNPGEPIHDHLLTRIRQSDFVIAILTAETPSVLYEAGVSDGLRKPMLVVASQDALVPEPLRSHTFVRTELKDSDVLRIAVTNFVEEFSKQPKVTRKRSPKAQADTKRIGELLERVTELRKQPRGEEVERAVYQLLLASGLRAVESEPRSKDKGVDFAVWSDALGPVLGTLMLVEVKTGQLNEGRLAEAEKQLQGYLRKSDAKVGMLLYLDDLGRRFKETTRSSPFVLRYDLQDFAQELSSRAFADVVLAARNRLVHATHD